ncbi:vitamin B12 ABC transporter permease BtuC [Halomarina oriensis]|uniref:Vitamin B12 ABC transporter permease BtuC n=1 Tax=Halomarina oriensis TaxID=671145 RepID=A0A6B0GFB9_9EURY|nr:vitamin B12 ABC transporter permease BtuC [Halomarina oriensis]
MQSWRRLGLWCGGLAAALVAVSLGSVAYGTVDLSPVVVAKAMLNAVSVPAGLSVTGGALGVPLVGQVPWLGVDLQYVRPFGFAVPASAQTIVVQLRAPRVALAAVVGFALASAGTVMQGFFRNPMADPSIVGVSTGAAVGAVTTIVFPGFVAAIPLLGLVPLVGPLQVFAFASALVTAFTVYLVATDGGRTPVATLLLAGVAIQTLLGAVVSYLLLQADESVGQALYWLMGHLSAASWNDVVVTLPLALVGFVVLAVYSRDLNVLLMGEEDAHALGIEVERTKRVLLAVSSLVTAAAVAVAGVVGFVGLVVPHVMRLLVGPDHRLLLPTSALAGSVFLVATDAVARSGPAELPVGIVTAALGAPFFLYLLRSREVRTL